MTDDDIIQEKGNTTDIRGSPHNERIMSSTLTNLASLCPRQICRSINDQDDHKIGRGNAIGKALPALEILLQVGNTSRSTSQISSTFSSGLKTIETSEWQASFDTEILVSRWIFHHRDGQKGSYDDDSSSLGSLALPDTFIWSHEADMISTSIGGGGNSNFERYDNLGTKIFRDWGRQDGVGHGDKKMLRQLKQGEENVRKLCNLLLEKCPQHGREVLRFFVLISRLVLMDRSEISSECGSSYPHQRYGNKYEQREEELQTMKSRTSSEYSMQAPPQCHYQLPSHSTDSVFQEANSRGNWMAEELLDALLPNDELFGVAIHQKSSLSHFFQPSQDPESFTESHVRPRSTIIDTRKYTSHKCDNSIGRSCPPGSLRKDLFGAISRAKGVSGKGYKELNMRITLPKMMLIERNTANFDEVTTEDPISACSRRNAEKKIDFNFCPQDSAASNGNATCPKVDICETQTTLPLLGWDTLCTHDIPIAPSKLLTQEPDEVYNAALMSKLGITNILSEKFLVVKGGERIAARCLSALIGCPSDYFEVASVTISQEKASTHCRRRLLRVVDEHEAAGKLGGNNHCSVSVMRKFAETGSNYLFMEDFCSLVEKRRPRECPATVPAFAAAIISYLANYRENVLGPNSACRHSCTILDLYSKTRKLRHEIAACAALCRLCLENGDFVSGQALLQMLYQSYFAGDFAIRKDLLLFILLRTLQPILGSISRWVFTASSNELCSSDDTNRIARCLRGDDAEDIKSFSKEIPSFLSHIVDGAYRAGCLLTLLRVSNFALFRACVLPSVVGGCTLEIMLQSNKICEKQLNFRDVLECQSSGVTKYHLSKNEESESRKLKLGDKFRAAVASERKLIAALESELENDMKREIMTKKTQMEYILSDIRAKNEREEVETDNAWPENRSKDDDNESTDDVSEENLFVINPDNGVNSRRLDKSLTHIGEVLNAKYRQLNNDAEARERAAKWRKDKLKRNSQAEVELVNLYNDENDKRIDAHSIIERVGVSASRVLDDSVVEEQIVDDRRAISSILLRENCDVVPIATSSRIKKIDGDIPEKQHTENKFCLEHQSINEKNQVVTEGATYPVKTEKDVQYGPYLHPAHQHTTHSHQQPSPPSVAQLNPQNTTASNGSNNNSSNIVLMEEQRKNEIKVETSQEVSTASFDKRDTTKNSQVSPIEVSFIGKRLHDDIPILSDIVSGLEELCWRKAAQNIHVESNDVIANKIPLEVAIFLCIAQPIEQQLEFVTKTVVSHFFCGNHIFKHLHFLRKVMLGEGLYVRCFALHVGSNVDNGTAYVDWRSVVNVLGAHRSSLASAGIENDDDCAKCFSYETRDMELGQVDSFYDVNPDSLRFLEAVYFPPKPMNFIFDRYAMKKYNKIQVFFLRHHSMKDRINGTWLCLFKSRFFDNPLVDDDSKRYGRPRRHRWLCSFQNECLRFVSSLSQYLENILWEAESDIENRFHAKDIGGIRELYSLHIDHLDWILNATFQNNNPNNKEIASCLEFANLLFCEFHDLIFSFERLTEVGFNLLRDQQIQFHSILDELIKCLCKGGAHCRKLLRLLEDFR